MSVLVHRKSETIAGSLGQELTWPTLSEFRAFFLCKPRFLMKGDALLTWERIPELWTLCMLPGPSASATSLEQKLHITRKPSWVLPSETPIRA
eukprot:2439480-Amphidinium_carterae.1